ncbi:MAG: hypothetical protein AB9900_12615 [Humidesulfovibrio sp.]
MPPKKGESKQDFLGRCAREKRDAGMSEDKAMAACAGEWNQARMAAVVDDNMLHLAAPVDITLAAQGEDGAAQEPDRFGILAYTGKLIDWSWHRFIIDLKGMKLAKAKVPCLHGHYSGSIVGTVDKSSQDANGFFVSGEFSRVATSKGPEVLEHAREGFPWQSSIGVQGVKVLHVDKGATHKVNGQTVEGPCDVWLESTVFEVSFVPFGADDDTAAIAMSHDGSKGDGKTHLSQEEETMPHTAAPDAQNLSGQPGAGTPPPVAPPAGVTDTAALEAAKADAAKLAAQAQQDAAALLTHGQTLNLSMKDVQGVLALGLSKEQATAKLLDLAAGKNPPVGTGTLVMGADEADKFRLAATHGLRMRLGQKIEKAAPGHEEFRGLSLHELGRRCLERIGINPRGMTASEVARKVLSLSAGAMGSSDFAAISIDAVNVTLQKAYVEAAATWRQWCSVTSASNYKEIHGIALSEAPDLEKVLPGGEYKNAAFKDKQESYVMAKYGKIIPITEEAIVNDDTRAFTRLPQLAGAAAARTVSKLVYALLASNPVMKETGKTLFHADHKNLAATTAVGGVTSAILSAMRQLMRKQKGMNGAALSLIPKFLLLPTTYETDAEILLRSVTLPVADMPTGVHNPWAGQLTPVVDGWLDNASADIWYMAADPNQVDTFEVAFLDGNEQPLLTEDDEFRRDVLSLKVKQVVGVGAMDFRGLVKNPGK